MAFCSRNKEQSASALSPNQPRQPSWIFVQYGRPTLRRLSSVDVSDIEQLDRIILCEVQNSQEIEFSESFAILWALKNFVHTVLDGDGKTSGSFSSKDRPLTRCSVQYGRPTMRSLSSNDLTGMEQLDIKSLDEVEPSLEQGEIELKSIAYLQALLEEDVKKSERFSFHRCLPTAETEIFGTILLSSSRQPNATDLLNQLETQSIYHKIMLKRIELTYKNNETKREQLDDLRQAIYKAQEIIKRLQYLVKEPFENRIQETSKYIGRLGKACKIVNEIRKDTKLMSYKDIKDRICIETVRLCSLLGLRLDFLDHLQHVSPRIRNHRSFSEWIVTFLRENYESLSFSEKGSLSKELLLSIGFDSMSPTVETVLARSLAGNMQQHIEPCEWAEIFIEDEFKYNLLLSPQADKFPFQNDSTNTWFPHSIENEYEERIHVQIMNLVIEESETSEKTACSKLHDQERELEQEKHTVLFHGTDHESARDILVRGIDLSAGRQKRDFSCGLGFYLTKHYIEALNWAKSITAKPAILMFHVKRDCFNKFRKQTFVETSADDMTKWHKVVSSCRSGKLTAEIRKLFTEFDWIDGPKAIITGRNEAGELLIKPKPSSHQMCLFSEELADEFNKNIHSILFCDH